MLDLRHLVAQEKEVVSKWEALYAGSREVAGLSLKVEGSYDLDGLGGFGHNRN